MNFEQFKNEILTIDPEATFEMTDAMDFTKGYYHDGCVKETVVTKEIRITTSEKFGEYSTLVGLVFNEQVLKTTMKALYLDEKGQRIMRKRMGLQ